MINLKFKTKQGVELKEPINKNLRSSLKRVKTSLNLRVNDKLD